MALSYFLESKFESSSALEKFRSALVDSKDPANEFRNHINTGIGIERGLAAVLWLMNALFIAKFWWKTVNTNHTEEFAHAIIYGMMFKLVGLTVHGLSEYFSKLL